MKSWMSIQSVLDSPLWPSPGSLPSGVRYGNGKEGTDKVVLITSSTAIRESLGFLTSLFPLGCWGGLRCVAFHRLPSQIHFAPHRCPRIDKKRRTLYPCSRKHHRERRPIPCMQHTTKGTRILPAYSHCEFSSLYLCSLLHRTLYPPLPRKDV